MKTIIMFCTAVYSKKQNTYANSNLVNKYNEGEIKQTSNGVSYSIIKQ